MEHFPENIKFIYPWRSYQQQALDSMEVAIKDRHFHVVAPPGSGKTVLGLEAMIRLDQATLILSPTLTIRDQWISRFCELFLQKTTVPDWISTDIRSPKFMTIVTYQGLNAACKTSADIRDVVDKLKKENVQTFILDEAHHLKNQWWTSLDKVKKALSPVVVGLTATPPYDSSYTEWDRYLDMNGEIDLEISVPELIKDGDLCPHQDFVYFSQPTPEEYKQVTKYRSNISSVFDEFSRSDVLIDSFRASELWINPIEHLEWIYENIKVYTSYLILMIHNQIEIPNAHLEILGFEIERKDESKRSIFRNFFQLGEEHKSKRKISEMKPELSYDRLELLLNYFLFQDKHFFNEYENEKQEIVAQLRTRSAIERNMVQLMYSSKMNGLLSASSSKLQSIVHIAEFEYSCLKDDLRLVVLSDFIREEYLHLPSNEDNGSKKMGVVTIFQTLLDSQIQHDKLGVLTGSLVILPKSSEQRFRQMCDAKNISDTNALYTDYRSEFLLINNSSAIKDKIVDITTQLFTEGEIKILIGTKSLLGEGWDAPCINSLILASFVGSFVLSNQMRGRAIRTQKGNPQKTGSIWHLVCVDPLASNGGQDLDVLSKRFKTFIGLSNGMDIYIENGFDRLNVSLEKYSDTEINLLNKTTFEVASDRHKLAERWGTAIEQGVSVVNEIEIPYPKSETPYEATLQLHYNRTIKYMAADLMLVFSIFGYEIFTGYFTSGRFLNPTKDLYQYLVYIAFLALLYCGRETYKTIKTYIKYRDISKDLGSIAQALLRGLIKQESIKTNESDLSVHSIVDQKGAITCFLKGATKGEQTIFIRSLMEILNVVDNPRYIIVRKDTIWKLSRNDYHAVPILLGGKKNLATYFHSEWSSSVGNSDLIYTRTVDGRKLLLKARVNSLSASFEDEQIPKENRKWV